MVITDPEGNIQYVNPGFEKITGYHASEVLGKTPSILKSGLHSREFYENMWTTIQSGQIWRGRIQNRRNDGTIYSEDMSISAIRDDSANIVNYVAVKRDITQELHLEAQSGQVVVEPIGQKLLEEVLFISVGVPAVGDELKLLVAVEQGPAGKGIWKIQAKGRIATNPP